jgi:hypothetical protein
MGSLTRAAILKGLALHIKKAGFEDYSNTYTVIDFEEERLGWGSVEQPSRQSLFDKPIATGKLASGIYLLKVSQGNRSTTKRVIISK